MTNKELNEYIQLKRRRADIPKKRVLEYIGKQENGSWILGDGIFISSKGMEIPSAECNSIWISNLFKGQGIPNPDSSCLVSLPISTSYLRDFFEVLAETLQHNFIPALLVIGSTSSTFGKWP